MINVNNNATSTAGVNNPSQTKAEPITNQDFNALVQQRSDFLTSNEIPMPSDIMINTNNLPYDVFTAAGEFIDKLAETGESTDELLGQLSDTFNSKSQSISPDIQELANTVSGQLDGLSESMDKLSDLLKSSVEGRSPVLNHPGVELDPLDLKNDNLSKLIDTLDLHNDNIDELGKLVDMIKSGDPMSMYTGTSSDLLNSLNNKCADLDQFFVQIDDIVEPEFGNFPVEIPDFPVYYILPPKKNDGVFKIPDGDVRYILPPDFSTKNKIEG